MLRIRIRDWVPFWPLDPGSGMGESQHPGSGINNPDHFFLSLETIFLLFLGLKHWNSLMRIRDPGWRQFGSGIRDGKKSDSGYGINIPDPPHWLDWYYTEQNKWGDSIMARTCLPQQLGYVQYTVTGFVIQIQSDLLHDDMYLRLLLYLVRSNMNIIGKSLDVLFLSCGRLEWFKLNLEGHRWLAAQDGTVREWALHIVHLVPSEAVQWEPVLPSRTIAARARTLQVQRKKARSWKG